MSKKFANIYKLPMIVDGDCILDESCRYKIDFDMSDSNCDDQTKAVANAINNHDDMVEAIEMVKRAIENMPLCDSYLYDIVEKELTPLIKKVRG